jgi:para-nitrobenzyl esterase
LGAYHTAELQYLFTNADFFGLPLGPLSHKQKKLSDAMISYWTQFAKTGNPNSPHERDWPPYNASTGEFQSLTPPTPRTETNFDAIHNCSTFWDTF